MRIAVCVKSDLFGAIVLNHVVPRLLEAGGHELAVFMSVRERVELEDSVPELDLMRMVERQVPMNLVFPLLDAVRPDTGAVPMQMATPRQLAARTGWPLTLVHDMTPAGGVMLIEAFAPDLILSVRFSYLFRRSAIAMAKAGIINVHPGPLPGYRGLYAPFWQMLRGQNTLRCTVHLVDAGIDTGPVLSIEDVTLVASRSLLWHANRLYLAGAGRAVDYILGGQPEPQPQDPALAHSHGFPSPEDFARFGAMGFSLVRGGDYQALLLPFVTPAAAFGLPQAA